jgi:hypothetical protein
MHKVHADFGHPSLDTYHLFSLTVMLQGRRECRGSEQHCYLQLCSLSGIIVNSQTYGTFDYWMMGIIVLQPVAHKLFASFPVTL